MAWETRQSGGRYYTRSKRVNGRVVREYVGTGFLAELLHQADMEDRERRDAQRKSLAETMRREDGLDCKLDEFSKMADEVARGLLIVAGCYQHNRGSWRKRNASNENQDT